MKKIFKAIYYLVISGIIVVAIFLILSVSPIKSGYKSFVVLSGSMEPKIKTGSVVLVRESGDYQVGEVVTFGKVSKTKMPTTHRIISVDKSGDVEKYTTKGDANNTEDSGQVLKSEIIGKVIFSLPYVGYAVNATQKPVGFVLIIIIPAVIIIYDEILNIKKEVLKKIDYKKLMKKRKKSASENLRRGRENLEDISKEDNEKEI